MDETESVASIDLSTIDTPTHTTDHDTPLRLGHPDHRRHFAPTPSPGRIYIIRNQTLHKVISLRDGRLSLGNECDLLAGYYWECVETCGWLGFRETVSGNYLGRGDHKDFRATVKHHKPWEWFVARGAGHTGYYYLQSPGTGRNSLTWISIDTTTTSEALISVSCNTQAAIWEFEDVTIP
ncbi:hypothetical protein F4777DRAFT_580100 [Nemania sp. FL0916]|nr:hypothetical protein F4777DRAFT_580100 [Nemania sp. FL0916]